MSAWQLQNAKNRFSEVVKRARDEGPQTVTVHGKRAAMVLSADAYDALTKPRTSFAAYLLEGPLWPDEMIGVVGDPPQNSDRDTEF
jgi:prevent-host-death family protein